MITSKKKLDLIRKIVAKHYKRLLITVAGKGVFSETELQKLRDQGFNVDKEDSLLELIYYHHLLNDVPAGTAPKTLPEMKAQQKKAEKPQGDQQTTFLENANENLKHLVEKQKADVQSRIEGLIREYNLRNRPLELAALDQPEEVASLLKEKTIEQIKQDLRDYTTDANRNWKRIAVTEASNAVGVGSVDRVLAQNEDANLDEIYVYRVSVLDAALCKWCREFYVDGDDSPALYKLSTILSNGSNYGKKPSTWKPVVTATHPNERCAGVQQLRPGWKLLPGGSVEFIGLEKWSKYLESKLRN